MVGVVALNLAVVKKLIYKNKNSSYPCSFIRVFKKYELWIISMMICSYWYLWNLLSVGLSLVVVGIAIKTMTLVVPV